MVSAAGAADCAQGDGTYVRQKNMPGNILVAERKSWNGNRECLFYQWKVDQFHSGVELTDHC